jgi:hypothetical protein
MNYPIPSPEREKFFYINLGDLLHDVEEFFNHHYGHYFDLTEAMEVIIEGGIARSADYLELRKDIRRVTYHLIDRQDLAEHLVRELDGMIITILDYLKELFVSEYPDIDNYAEKGWVTNSVILADHGSAYCDNTNTFRRCALLSLSLYKM